jgi:hypothetical protein
MAMLLLLLLLLLEVVVVVLLKLLSSLLVALHLTFARAGTLANASTVTSDAAAAMCCHLACFGCA